MREEIWTCDICGRKFSKKDVGYASCEPLKLTINLGEYGGNEVYNYDDVCSDCRDKINQSIFETIQKLQLKNEKED